MSKDGITLKGSAARAFMASLLIDSHGEAAAKGTTGPMKEEIEAQLAAKKSRPESSPWNARRDEAHPGGFINRMDEP